jgi:hypothetical protein
MCITSAGGEAAAKLKAQRVMLAELAGLAVWLGCIVMMVRCCGVWVVECVD